MTSLNITDHLKLIEEEIEFNPIRSQGSGGQNVNKVSTAIHLRFNIHASSLPEFYKQRLLSLKDKRISKDGDIIIKAQSYRTQEKNKNDALNRLVELIKAAGITRKKRRPTKPTRNSQRKRLDNKTRHSRLKALRNKQFQE